MSAFLRTHRRWLWVLMVLVLLFGAGILWSATREEAIPEPDPEPPVQEPEPEPEPEPVEEPEPEPEEESREGMLINPYTGLWEEEARVLRRPLAIMLDNNVKARPHRGLLEADVVMEILVEGGSTRLMPIYVAGEPSVVGPVRSARAYFLDLTLGMDALLVHCGGSPGALAQIRDMNVPVFNDLAGQGIFFRDPIPGIPFEHTLFTRIPETRDLMVKQAREVHEAPLLMWQFADNHDDLGAGQPPIREAPYVELAFPGYFRYRVAFEWDSSDGRYYRTIHDVPHVDRDTEEQVATDNIIVMWAPTRVVDSVGRLDIQFVGEGPAVLVTQGKAFEIRFQKDAIREPLQFIGPEGEAVRLAPGQTWIEVLPIGTDISWGDPEEADES